MPDNYAQAQGHTTPGAIMGNELLQGERIFLDALRRDDLADMTTWLNDLETMRLLSPTIVRPQTLQDHVDWYDEKRKDDTLKSLAIRLKDSRAFIGFCDLVWVSKQARHMEVGIAIGDRTNRGQGYGHDAMTVLLRYAFQEWNANRIGLEVFSYNARGVKSYERLGFQHEGRLRETLYRDGRYYDTILMSILRDEWEATQV